MFDLSLSCVETSLYVRLVLHDGGLKNMPCGTVGVGDPSAASRLSLRRTGGPNCVDASVRGLEKASTDEGLPKCEWREDRGEDELRILVGLWLVCGAWYV